MRFFDSQYILQSVCRLNGAISLSNQADVEQPCTGTIVERLTTEDPQYKVTIRYGNTAVVLSTPQGVLMDEKTMFCKTVEIDGWRYFIQAPIYVLAGLLINKYIIEAKISDSRDSQRYSLELSLRRINGQIDNLKSFSLLSASINSAQYAVNLSSGVVAVENTELVQVFSDVTFARLTNSMDPLLANISTLPGEYQQAIRSSLESDSNYTARRDAIRTLVILPDTITHATMSSFPVACLNYRKALEYAFPDMIVFDVLPAQIELAKLDVLDSYIKGRLYNLALENRDVTVSATTSGLFDSMVQFAKYIELPWLAAFLSNAINDTSDYENKFAQKQCAIARVLSNGYSSVDFDIRELTQDQYLSNKSSVIRDIKALYAFILAVLCDNAKVKLEASGGCTITINVYESSLLAYLLNGVIKLKYRS